MPPPMLARGAALALATMLLAAAVHAKDVSSAAPAFERSGPAPARVATSDGQWIRLSPPPPRSRHSAAYDSVRDQMVVVCGLSSVTGKAVNEVWVLSMLGVPSWRKVVTLGAPPPARYYQTLIHDIARDRLIMMGGYDGVSFKNDVWALSLADFSWTQLSPTGTPPSVRWGHVAAYDAAGDRMVVFGGQTSGGTLLNDAWQLSLAGSTTWTVLSPTGTKPRCQARPSNNVFIACALPNSFSAKALACRYVESSAPVTRSIVRRCRRL